MASPNRRLRGAWRNMLRRCTLPADKDYSSYGGRGISVCARWRDFSAFSADMGPHPGRGWSLDRKNNNRGYSRGNCQWATPTTQARNKQSTKLTVALVAQMRSEYVPGTRWHPAVSLSVLAKRYGVSKSVAAHVIDRSIWK